MNYVLELSLLLLYLINSVLKLLYLYVFSL